MKPNWLLTLILAIAVGVGVYFYKPQEAEMKLKFPYTIAVDPTTDLSCDAIVGNVMYGSNNDLREGIVAKLLAHVQ